MDRFTGNKHHNPHAHVIHQPGRRLMHSVKLKYVWNKVTGHGGAKIGNVHLKWAFSESVLWMLRYSDDAKAFLKRKEKKYGKCRAMTMLARKIARAVYQMLKRNESFDAVKFFAC